MRLARERESKSEWVRRREKVSILLAHYRAHNALAITRKNDSIMFYTFVFVIASINHLISELCSFHSFPSFFVRPFVLGYSFFSVVIRCLGNLLLLFFDGNKTKTQSNVAVLAQFHSLLDRFMHFPPLTRSRLLRTWECDHKLIQIASFLVVISREFYEIVLLYFLFNRKRSDHNALTVICVWHHSVGLHASETHTHTQNGCFQTFQMNIKKRMHF